ncbi:phosphatidylserine/phosphatidylglycerophosphate/cardiolipin synthase-like enzyme [Streptomyces sp. V4I23]|uniref:DISARM system phospholipase D-like protein DrmC n=1 Tax=Streptomyces sp. V4I23 TaxID=3042282 RepID=UPI00278410FB|nr:DISARM system phospholipase D-like protein DrmC [Streptomyces sp. V4I23]MDQ1010382.1 phosphatidylserine/phosphatidylglycerophosphate/cardiolipin synthase-like enzyme [Streptomyces sp. V4I23]
MNGRLPVLLAALAKRLPSHRMSDPQRHLRLADGPADPLLDRWAAAHPAAGLSSQLGAMRAAWRDEAPGLPGTAIALSLSTADAYEQTEAPPAELVVSGPTSHAIPVRLTSAIAIDVIRSARDSLLIASFAAYKIAEIVTELRAAADRNVRIDLLLEESTAAARAFGQLHGQVRIWHRADVSARGSLHAKVIAADRRIALLGSANLTDRALSDNVEIGIILRDPRTVGRLVDHLRWLTGPEAGFLQPV